MKVVERASACNGGFSLRTAQPWRCAVLFLTTLALATAQPPSVSQRAAQPAKPPPSGPVPRMPDGHPNLEGIWQPRTSGAAYSILPHQGGFFLGAGSDTGVVEGGVLPYQPWAAEIVKDLTQHMEFDPTGHCHYEGIPHANYFGFQFFQTPTQIAVLYENMHARRIIYMTGNHPSDYLSWMGDSRGRWEGDTLVVDVANNNDKSVYDMAGHFHSDAEHVVERYTMVDSDNINWEATINDPKVFTRPWKMKFPLRRAAKDYEILESGCFEGERDAVHLVEGLATIPADHYKQ